MLLVGSFRVPFFPFFSLNTFSASFFWLALALALALLSPTVHAQASRPAPVAVPGAPGWPARFGEAPGVDRKPDARPALRPASAADVIVTQQAIVYTWDGTTWVNPIRRIMTYDAAARLIGVETSNFLTGGDRGWQTLTYNARGQLTEWVFDAEIAGTRYPQERYVYTFDSSGNPLESRQEGWNGTTGVIRYATQHEYQYDAAGRVTQDIYRSYDNLPATFVNLTRTSYTYAGSPQWNTLLNERWDPTAGTWGLESQFVEPVFEANPVPRLLSYRIHGWTGSAFVEVGRMTFIWESDGGSVEVRESYDPVQGWQNDWRTVNDINIYGDPLELRIERWFVPNGWLIQYGSRSISTYLPTGERTQEIQQIFRAPGGGYFNETRIDYSDFRTIPTGLSAEAGDAGMRLYPNPTTGLLTVEAPADATTATVRDAVGRVVHTVRLAPHAGRVSLDLSALPAGVYSVGLQTAAGPVVRRVVRQ